VGGFDSFVLTLVAALVLGVAQAEVNNYVQITGAEDTIPFLVIVVVLMIRGSALPIRGYLFDRFPRTGTGRISARLIVPAVLFVSVLIIISRSSLNWLTAITSTMAIALILLSLVVLMGMQASVTFTVFVCWCRSINCRAGYDPAALPVRAGIRGRCGRSRAGRGSLCYTCAPNSRC